MAEKKLMSVLGAAESGVGAAVLAKKKGYDVYVSDAGTIKPKYKEMLEHYGLKYDEGMHNEEIVLSSDEVVKSPGIPNDAPIVKKIEAKGIGIISEIELAGRYTDAKMICITGSNGKTTTTSLTYHILKAAGLNVGLAGNIGRSLALQVAEENFDYYVIELSSFQLDNMYDFRANVAVLLNITPDHLDRYGYNFQNYVDSKMRVIRNQTEDDAFVYWMDSPVVAKELKKYGIKSRMCPFSAIKKDGAVAYADKGEYVIEQPMPFNMELESLSLTGRHNLYNSLAAGITAKLAGVSDEVLRRSLSDFPGVEHRLEKVAKVRGVQYVNDSKATNVDACWYALESMKTPVVLILGGKDKGNDYTPIKEMVKSKCRALVYLGADNAKLHKEFDSLGVPFADTHDMNTCVAECYKFAQPGDTVLLSPCCASFDLFHNMEERGELFKQAVKAL